jgi:thiol:disulfide interchange protein
MEAWLSELYSGSSWPLLSALILGLMTAISPCPLATNITAMGYISRDIQDRRKVFLNGIYYTLGRAVSYTGLAAILYIGADQFRVSGLFQQYGEKLLGPLMILIALFMLGVFNMAIPGLDRLTTKFQNKKVYGFFDVFFLGVLFALAFCPYSGVLYFGMLIPMTIQSASGLLLPVVFALATGIPVIIFAWLLAYTVSGVGKMYKKIKLFELWFRRVVAVAFLGFGIYYTIITLF